MVPFLLIENFLAAVRFVLILGIELLAKPDSYYTFREPESRPRQPKKGHQSSGIPTPLSLYRGQERAEVADSISTSSYVPRKYAVSGQREHFASLHPLVPPFDGSTRRAQIRTVDLLPVKQAL